MAGLFFCAQTKIALYIRVDCRHIPSMHLFQSIQEEVNHIKELVMKLVAALKTTLTTELAEATTIAQQKATIADLTSQLQLSEAETAQVTDALNAFAAAQPPAPAAITEAAAIAPAADATAPVSGAAS